jgi:hypothetical protein
MSHRTAAVAATLITLIPLIAAPKATAAGPLVVYDVGSNGPLSSISYYDATHQMQQITNVASPWELTFRSQETYPTYAVSAQTTGTDVNCQILLDGRVVNQNGVTGNPHSLAGCAWSASSGH